MKNKFIILLAIIFFAKPVMAGFEILELKLVNNLPYVKLQIEDISGYFLLDTGARNQVLVVDKNIISQLKTLRPFNLKDKAIDITGKKYLAAKYILPNFNIGGLKFYQVRVAEDTKWGLTTANAQKAEEEFGKIGVIGLELFTDKKIIIDYLEQKLIIADEPLPPEYDINSWQKVNYKLDRLGLSVFLKIDDSDNQKKFLIDSGSNISIIRPSAIGKNIIQQTCDNDNNKLGCAVINPKFFIIDDIKLNTTPLLIYLFDGIEAHGILGYQFLADKKIFYDFKERIMRLKLGP